MAGPAAILRDLHRLRRHARNLQDEIERVPRMLKAHQGKAARAEEALRQGQEEVKRLRIKTHEKETELKAAQQQIAKYEQQRNQATTRKEYDTLNAEIAHARQKCQQLEDGILASMLAVDEQTAKLPELEREVQKAKAEYAAYEKTAGERRASLTAQLNQALQELKEVEAGLPADVRQHYERQVAARGEDALAAAHNRTCTACNTEMTAQMYNELLRGQFVLCKSCGRILYLPEQAAPKEEAS